MKAHFEILLIGSVLDIRFQMSEIDVSVALKPVLYNEVDYLYLGELPEQLRYLYNLSQKLIMTDEYERLGRAFLLIYYTELERLLPNTKPYAYVWMSKDWKVCTPRIRNKDTETTFPSLGYEGRTVH